MLRQVGLAGMPHRVSMFGDKATAAGHTAELVGGYADAGRTILFVRVDPPARVLATFGNISLSDQFGRTYFMTGMASDVATGENTMLFKPMPDHRIDVKPVAPPGGPTTFRSPRGRR